MRRAAVSIEANIAEGSRIVGRFYAIIKGSAEEPRCFLILAKDLGFLRDAGAMLYRLVIPKTGAAG
jgi:four helix bundle protein